MADKEFLAALHEQEKLDQLVVDLDLTQYENVIISVNGKTGAVVLSTTDINEGTNLYYTNARADDRVALIIDDSITNLLKAWSGQKVTDAISAGSVESAAKWTTPMDFTFGGDLVGSGSFDGSAAATFSGTVPGKVDNSRVLTDVPANAIFTDTVYDDTTIWDAVNLNTAKVGITSAQAAAIEANTAHGSRVDNPHLLTAAQVQALSLNGGSLSGSLTLTNASGDLILESNSSDRIVQFKHSEDSLFNIHSTNSDALSLSTLSNGVSAHALHVVIDIDNYPTILLPKRGSDPKTGGKIDFDPAPNSPSTNRLSLMVKSPSTDESHFRMIMPDPAEPADSLFLDFPQVDGVVAVETLGQITQFNSDMKMPRGWQICDGTKGTPDMTADFKTYGTTEVVYIQFTGNH